MESSEAEQRRKALKDILQATRMSDGTPLPDTTRVNVSAGDLRTLLAAVGEAKSQLAKLLNLMKEQAHEEA